jgi:ribonuclease G
MSTELIINASLPETRIAMMENGEIQELLIERASGKGIVGNIYKGRVTRVLPGMQAAFVDIGLEKAAFLYVDDVYVHSEIWEEEEGEEVEAIASSEEGSSAESVAEGNGQEAQAVTEGVDASAVSSSDPRESSGAQPQVSVAGAEASDALADPSAADVSGADLSAGHGTDLGEDLEVQEEIIGDFDDLDEEEDFDEEEEDEDSDDHGPVGMGPGRGEGGDDEGGSSEQPEGTIAPPQHESSHSHESERASSDEGAQGAEFSESDAPGEGNGDSGDSEGGNREGGRRRHRRGRRGGRFRRRDREGREGGEGGEGREQNLASGEGENLPENFDQQVSEQAQMQSDRSALAEQPMEGSMAEGTDDTNRPEATQERGEARADRRGGQSGASRPEFREQRARDRKIKPKQAARPVRTQVNIQDLLKEGQEVIVQVAKDPIATKGARLTCHISLPGRHLVCMPTIDHVGVSRRIERDDERRKLREHVERYRPRNLGFIVRTASGKGQSEKRIKQDIDYLSRLWNEIREKAASVTAPALVYEDLNSVLRAIRDWVTEDIDKIIVDSRYHYNEIQKFVSHFMPALKQKVELYHGDIPIFDAYGISTELSRALERKVWLKSGGYIVIDQAEALVAIDVNTGRYVGKKNLEDTILKTNLEAVQEIAYQLRLRNCGGIIILDLIDMEKEENKQRVYRALEEALKKDRARPSILKISELGLVEMTRKRTRDTMVRALCESCSHCEGKGFIKSKQTVAYEALREIEREGIEKDVGKILVQAHADVIDLLAIDERETMDQLERRYRKQIYLQAVMDYHPEQFEVSGDKVEGGRTSRGSERASSQRMSGNNRSQNQRDSGEGDRSRGGGQRDQRSDRNRGERGDRGDQQEVSAQRGGRDRDRGGQGRDRDDRRGGRDRDRGRDRNRDRNRDRDRDREQQNRQHQTQGPIIPVEGTPVGASNEDPDSQARYLGVIEKKGYASPEKAPPNFNGAEAGADGEAPAQAGTGPQDFYDEEDRLAFLRAQAAQDAALAKLRGPEGGIQAQGRNHSSNQRSEGGSGSNRDRDRDRGGRNGRRGRRGKRGSSGGQNRDRGNFQGGGSGQRFSNRDSQPASAPSDSAGETGDTSGSGGGNPGSDGGSSGHSQPPV